MAKLPIQPREIVACKCPALPERDGLVRPIRREISALLVGLVGIAKSFQLAIRSTNHFMEITICLLFLIVFFVLTDFRE